MFVDGQPSGTATDVLVSVLVSVPRSTAAGTVMMLHFKHGVQFPQSSTVAVSVVVDVAVTVTVTVTVAGGGGKRVRHRRKKRHQQSG